jgi:hypothetical protein
MLSGTLARAGTIRADVNPQVYLDLGAQAKYANVGRVNTTLSTGALISSGTLIAPDVVLTAAHTLDGAASLSFFVGGSTYTASQWSAYPLWTSNLEAGYDLGLVRLSSPVLNVTPATRYTGKSELGMTVTEVGYGMTGTGLTGATRYDGKKRAGTNRIDSLSAGSGSSARLMWMDFDQPNSRSRSRISDNGPTLLEYLIARGDSGGGLFMDTKSGTQLIGVSSFGYSLDGKVDASYGEKAGFTRVSAFNSWIDAMLRQFSVTTSFGSTNLSVRPGLRATELFVSVPEPSTATIALGALLVLLLGVRRPRSQRRGGS